MSKGSATVILGVLSIILPFTGFPTNIKTGIAVVLGILIVALGFLSRQERLWLRKTIDAGNNEEFGAHHGSSQKETLPQ